MNYTLILRPLIGAGIGYVTNYIAVKMMFRPLKPIKIGKFTLPFTPGIIPKNKKRIAHSIALTVSENLITEDDLNNTLLSDEVKNHIRKYLTNIISSDNNYSIENTLLNTITTEDYLDKKEKITSFLSKEIIDALNKANIGKILSEQIVLAVQDKINGSLLRAFINNAMITSLVGNVEDKINDYINENCDQMISNMISSKIDNLIREPISSLYTKFKNKNIDIIEILINLYESFIKTKITSILKLINIQKIIEDKINAMDMIELEQMILKIMKKELNALINLGALIGFILGLLNLLF